MVLAAVPGGAGDMGGGRHRDHRKQMNYSDRERERIKRASTRDAAWLRGS